MWVLSQCNCGNRSSKSKSKTRHAKIPIFCRFQDLKYFCYGSNSMLIICLKQKPHFKLRMNLDICSVKCEYHIKINNYNLVMRSASSWHLFLGGGLWGGTALN